MDYNICPVFGCDELYDIESLHSKCPRCGISRADIIDLGSNDKDIIEAGKLKKEFDKDINDLYNDALGG